MYGRSFVHFDNVSQDLSHWFKYGYVSHANQRGLYKLDLANMRYIRSIDLSPYNCVPRTLQFSSLCKYHHRRPFVLDGWLIARFFAHHIHTDGFVIIECEEPGTGHATGQVILDYLTDTVVNKKVTVRGSPLVSPDSRIVVSIDRAPDGVTLVVQQVLGNLNGGFFLFVALFFFSNQSYTYTSCMYRVCFRAESGLKFSFDVKTTLMISDIAFYPSRTTHGYDLYASASDKEDILFLNLSNGKLENRSSKRISIYYYRPTW